MNTRRTLRSNADKLVEISKEQTDAVKQEDCNEGNSKYEEEDSTSESCAEEEIDGASSKNTEIKENTSLSKGRKRVKSKFDSDSGSSSDSSVGDYLKNAAEIDLNSTFFKLDKSRKTPDFNSIEKKIFKGIKTLSDSDISDNEQVSTNVSDIEPASSVQDSNNEDKKCNFSQLHEYTRKLAEAKACVQKYEKKKFESENNVEISDLLAICETKNNESQDSMEFTHIGADSEDEMDWEEIEEGDEKPPDAVNIPKEGVQITLEMPTVVRKKKKGVDLMAAIKRRINRVKKENQVYIHKVHLLCWIAHGNFLNSVLNNENLLGLSLSLIPSENCYPKKHADLRYLEQIVRWYGKMMKIQEKPSDDNELPLLKSLEMQINKKQALSKRDLVLIFVIILRSLGLQCRLVLSLQCLPLRPPNSELCSLSTKENAAGSSKGSNKIEKSKSTAYSTRNSSSHNLNQSTDKNKSSKLNSSIRKTSNNAKKKGKLKIDDKQNEIKKPNLSKLKTQSPIAISSKVVPNKETSVSKLNTKTHTDRKTTTRSKSKAETNTKENISEKNKINKPSSSISTRSENKSSKVSQLDGANDSPSTSKSKQKNKPNLNKLKTSRTDNSRTDTCISKRHPRTVKLKDRKYKESTGDSEDDFEPNRRKSSTERSSGKEKDINSNKKKTTASTSKKANLDVRNDIINLIKGQMTEQRHSKKHKIVHRKTSQGESDYDSDYAPEPEIKKRRSNKKSSSDDDFKITINTNVKRRVKPRSQIDTRVLSTDDDESSSGGKKKKVGTDFWVEVFLEAEEKWISADVVKGQVHCVSELHSRASQPVSYILAWNNNFSLKDITARYSPHWNTVTRKLRVDSAWWNQTLKPYLGVKTSRDKQEDEDLARQQLDKPLPTTISEYKNHPLYALERHLLKFEAIYPPDSVTLGFVRKEPVYARECVHTLHSREIWVKHAKVVKPGEQPYKIVKARPKYDKLTGNTITDLPLELFGNWQIQDYVPPTAENGVVPRNAFGNVELFKQCMLPKKTVHLQLPGLNKIARKLQIDCAPAVVGFDFHCGGSHPTFDGYVVCEEFKDTLIAAWQDDREETARREQEKCEKRVYGSWRKLIKGLLIRERLKARYDFGNTSNSGTGKGKGKSKAPKVASKKRRIGSDNESDSD